MRRRKVLTQAFGRVVREARVRAGMSQERLAFRASVHPTYISQLERGLKSPSIEVVASIAKALRERPHVLIKAAEDAD
jgi:transcriptional regulator with XRE-family HTH domain